MRCLHLIDLQLAHILRVISPSGNQWRLTVYRMSHGHVDIKRDPLLL